MNFVKEEECSKSRAYRFYRDRFYWKNNHLKWNNFQWVIITPYNKIKWPQSRLRILFNARRAKKKKNESR